MWPALPKLRVGHPTRGGARCRAGSPGRRAPGCWFCVPVWTTPWENLPPPGSSTPGGGVHPRSLWPECATMSRGVGRGMGEWWGLWPSLAPSYGTRPCRGDWHGRVLAFVACRVVQDRPDSRTCSAPGRMSRFGDTRLARAPSPRGLYCLPVAGSLYCHSSNAWRA